MKRYDILIKWNLKNELGAAKCCFIHFSLDHFTASSKKKVLPFSIIVTWYFYKWNLHQFLVVIYEKHCHLSPHILLSKQPLNNHIAAVILQIIFSHSANYFQFNSPNTYEIYIVSEADIFRSLFVQTEFPGTPFVRTVLIRKEVKMAFILVTIGIEWATHRNYSRLFHSSIQRSISSCIGPRVRDC